MKYQWRVASITREGIEATTGRQVLSLKIGTIVIGYQEELDPDGNPFQAEITAQDGIEIEFDGELNPGERERLRLYLTTASREKLIERT